MVVRVFLWFGLVVSLLAGLGGLFTLFLATANRNLASDVAVLWGVGSILTLAATAGLATAYLYALRGKPTALSVVSGLLAVLVFSQARWLRLYSVPPLIFFGASFVASMKVRPPQTD